MPQRHASALPIQSSRRRLAAFGLLPVVHRCFRTGHTCVLA